MKIGILTFNWAINYGAILQMYAEYRYLNKKNEVVVINYVPDYFYNMYNPKILDKPIEIKSTLKKLLQKFLNYKQHKKFKHFISNELSLTKKAKNRKELQEIINGLDLVIVGSDQVWNYDITKEYIRDYLLTDIKCNKISYAASLGKNHIKNELIYLFEKSLNDFDFVSLREKASINYLKQICKRDDFKLCVDPVFLLNKAEWKQLAEKSNYKLPRNNFILIYMLEYNDNLIKVARYLSKKYKIPAVSIEIPFISLRRIRKMRDIKKLHDVGPTDFLKLFLNAKYILTNSFHGTAFSLIFEKQFISFAHSTVNLRMENLLNLYGLNNVQITNTFNDDFALVEEILKKSKQTYDKQNKEIDNIVKNSKEFLNNAMNKIKTRSRDNYEK
ncbi:MAG: polysaccharide pyruvyl transferase family protein [Thermosipho sp. (in: Bacteria)]|nr:polysaccharide pyruvyl transferase family protein [Thermosipho sp. (in: thermotogales)]